MRNIHTIRTNREPIKGDILLRHIWKNQPNECISWWRYNETIDIENVKQYTTLNGSFRDMYQSFEVRNLYITTKGSFARDEYITDGTEVIKATSKLVNAQGFADGRDWKKIVLTTDPDLIAEHIKSAGDEFLEWFVKNPSCEKVKVETFEVEDYVGFAGHTGYPTFHNEYKIIIPKEEPKTAWVGVLHDKLNEYHPAEYELKEIYQGEGCLPNFPNEELCQIWCDSNYKEVPKEEQKQHLIDMMKSDEELGLYEEPKKENCCTPVGQIKRYVDCVGCDRKPKQVWEQIIETCGGKDDFMEATGIKPKKETLEEAVAKKLYPLNDGFQVMDIDISEELQLAFLNGAKWQQENIPICIYAENIYCHIENGVVIVEKNDKSVISYSDEEVLDILREFYKVSSKKDFPLTNTIPLWFEQFKRNKMKETLEDFCTRELSNFNDNVRNTQFDLGFRTGAIIGLRFPKERSYNE